MIKKKLIIFLITIFLILAFAESYDVKGIEDLDYVIAIGIPHFLFRFTGYSRKR